MPRVLFILAVLFAPIVAAAATFHVPGDFSTIQAAIDATDLDDTVMVASGEYHENLFIEDKYVTIIGSGSAGEASCRLLPAASSVPTVRLLDNSGLASHITLSGLSFEGSFAGNAIEVEGQIVVTVSDCRFTDNQPTNAVLKADGSLIVLYLFLNLFYDNGGTYCVYAWVSGAWVQHNTLDLNQGGLFIAASIDHDIRYNCVTRTSGVGLQAQTGGLAWNNVWDNSPNYGALTVPAATDISVDPIYCDPASHDYGLHEVSTCAQGNNGSGTYIGAFEVGCNGCFDLDADGLCAVDDNCPTTHNPGQADWNGDGVGDACDDTDNDGVVDAEDNCVELANPDQADTNENGIGDACEDLDEDGVIDGEDNCVGLYNPGQEDDDSDGIGDACDACPDDAINDPDGDGICGSVDNCPYTYNPGQENSNGDILGDACAAHILIDSVDGLLSNGALQAGRTCRVYFRFQMPGTTARGLYFSNSFEAYSPDGADWGLAQIYRDKLTLHEWDGGLMPAVVTVFLNHYHKTGGSGLWGDNSEGPAFDPEFNNSNISGSDTAGFWLATSGGVGGPPMPFDELSFSIEFSTRPEDVGIHICFDSTTELGWWGWVDGYTGQIVYPEWDGPVCFLIDDCCTGKVGDVNLQGGDEPTIGDISALIDFLFIARAPLPCLGEADINQSGGAEPTEDDISIGDISELIDHLFISQNPLNDCL